MSSQVKLHALVKSCADAFALIVKNVNCIEMVTAARSKDNCKNLCIEIFCIYGRGRGRWNGEV